MAGSFQTRTRIALTRRLLAGVAPLAVLALGAPAFAQEEAAVDEVVVTGTRIRGVEAVGSNIVSVGRDEILSAGAATAGDLMRKFPQVQGLGPSATGASAQNGAANVTRSVGLNLRGISVAATLPLWDGRRFPASGTQGQLVDVSVIPTIALERIEVVADGASAIYGSDAITGVVNLIPRKRFKGVEVRGRYGFADGYEEYQVGIIAGHTWEGGSAVIAYEHADNSALDAQDLEYYMANLTSRGGRDYRTTSCNPGTITAGGATYAIPAGGVTSPAQLVRATANRCDTIKDNWVIPKQERNSVLYYVRQELNDRIALFSEGFYSKRNLTLRGNGGTPGATLTNQAVTNANPFFVTPVPGLTSVQVSYSFIPTVGFDRNPGFSESFDVVTGAEVKLWGDWKAEAAFSFGRSDDKISRRRNINAAAVTAALADRNPATSLNLFGGPNNPATLAAIRNGLFIIGARTGLEIFEVRGDGSIFELPGGPVRLALGAEHREEKLVSNLTAGNANVPTSTYNRIVRKMEAIYGEVFVPIVGEANATPGVQRLDLSLAARFEDYSDFGRTTNPKVGITWVPVDGLKVRGSYGTSFRAPAPADYDTIGGGAGLYGDNLPDPTAPNGTAFGIGIAGGNAGLDPEEAETWSFGFDWQPTSVPGFNLSATYFDIDYKGQILALRGTPGLLTNPIYAQFVTRNPTPAQVQALLSSGLPLNTPINPAAVTFIVDGRRQNLGMTIAKGFDLQVGYAWETGIGAFDANLSGSYFTTLKTAVSPTSVLVDVASVINNPQEWRARASLGWRNGPVRAQAALNLVDAYRNNTVTPVQTVHSYETLDLHVSYDLAGLLGESVGRDLTVALDITNALDRDPPYVDISGGYDPQSASPFGRLVAFSLSKRW